MPKVHPTLPDLPDDVVLRVSGVSKKFCRNLRRSMWYGIQDLAGNLLGGSGKRQEVGADVEGETSSTESLKSKVYSPKSVPDVYSLKSNSDGLRPSEFWALRNVSFDLRRGECLGLIGRNGCGKTTLLRLIAGIFPPDQGEIAIRGRVGALIALGAGFHPHMSGRENVYLNGAILGLTKKEIDAQFDEIIEFAEIGEFIDAPVSTYSSGMRVRLGFAVAIHIHPDVLLVDEVLAVGDFQFQRKCINKMKSLLSSGVAVVFVSHNLPTVGGLCELGVLLSHGRLVVDGSISEVIQQFLLMQDLSKPLESPLRSTARQSGEVVIHKIDILSKHGVCSEFKTGDSLTVRVYFECCSQLDNVIIGFGIYSTDENSTLCAANRSAYDRVLISLPAGRAYYEFRIGSLDLSTGKYRVGIVMFDDKIILPYVFDPEVALFAVRSPWLESPMTSPVTLPHVVWANKVNAAVEQ